MGLLKEFWECLAREYRAKFGCDFEESRGGSFATPAFRQPPVGIMPRKFHDERRMIALMDAVKRYAEAGFEPLPIWFEEIHEIEARWHFGRGGKSATPQTRRRFEYSLRMVDVQPGKEPLMIECVEWIDSIELCNVAAKAMTEISRLKERRHG